MFRLSEYEYIKYQTLKPMRVYWLKQGTPRTGRCKEGLAQESVATAIEERMQDWTLDRKWFIN